MIRVAIVGVGAISNSHIEAYQTFPERCEIVALVDRSIEKAEAKADAYGLKVAILDDAAKLKEIPGLDLVSICLPPSLHCEVAVDLLEAGIHVLCEKPLALSVAECDRMLEAAKKSGKTLSTVAQNRFKPDVVKAHALCGEGMLGTLLSSLVTSLWWRGENYYNLDWRGRWDSEGGGCTITHGIHHIDLMLWLMGEAEEVTAAAANRAHTNSELEDISTAIVRFKSGAVGTLVASILHHGEEQRMIVDGSDASVELPLRIRASRQLENGFPEDNTEALERLQRFVDNIKPGYTGHTAQIDDVLAALENGRESAVTGRDGRRAIELIMALYQSAFTGKPVQLPLTPADPFYTQQGLLGGVTRFYEKTVSIDRFNDDTIQVGGTL